MRLFVSLSPPTDVRNVLTRARGLLEERLEGSAVRWQDPEHSHLTIRFLGEVPESSLDTCRRAVAGAASGVAPFTLRTAGFGVFPGPGRPAVIWLGLEGDLDELGLLRGELERRLEPLTRADGTQPFRPHLTLGRVRRPTPELRGALGELLAGPGPDGAPWRVESLQLVRSRLLPGGARHTVLIDEPLRGPERSGGAPTR